MKSLEEIKEEESALKAQAEELCREATAEVRQKIQEVAKAREKIEVDLARNHEVQWREMAADVAEIARLSFLTLILGGFDNNFRVIGHVLWFEIRRDEVSDEYNYTRRLSFADRRDRNPNMTTSKEALSLAKEQYDKYVGRDV